MSSSHGLVDSWEYIISQSPTPHFLFQRERIVASAALPEILILNSTCHMYIYIWSLCDTIYIYTHRGYHMDNCERTRTSIHPARRKGVCKRQRHSIAKGWKIARRPETIPKNTILMDAKETSINHPSHGGCMAVAHIHSNWGNYFHTYNFSLFFSAYSQQT